MPIYAYKCSACGHEQDVLQKMSDPILTDCPQCTQSTYVKQVTAAGFQLKGTGWYVTDFRDNNKGGAPSERRGDDAGAASSGTASSGTASSSTASDSASSSASSSSAAD